MADAQFLRTLVPTLPTEFAKTLRTLCSIPSNELFLENFVRLLTGADCTSDASQTLRDEWAAKQFATRQALAGLVKPPANEPNGAVKRPIDDATAEGSKRQRVSLPETSTDLTSDPVQFTLHAVSTTSPVRKKVDISIRKTSVTFTNPSSGNVEATVPLSSLKRAFLLPTRGKTKAHWTVVILSSDVTEKSAAKDDSPQIIFGLDATATAPLYTTSANGKDTHAKGSPSLPAIRTFLSNLPKGVAQHEPSTDEFKSSVNQLGSSSASTTGVPGLEAYRAAKQGNLWFTKDGLLWGESKPCEFWALEDLLNPSEGVRLSPGSGRVFSVTVVRKSPPNDDNKMQVEGDEEEEDMGIETELGMIDSRERDGVYDWVRKHQNMFGRKPGDAPVPESAAPKVKAPAHGGPMTIRSLALDSDSEDEDFQGSDDDSGSGRGSGSEDSDDEDEDGDKDGDEEEKDAEGSLDEDEDADGELDPARHPLMRPGAMPKMSKAVMDAVVGMVEEDLIGGGEGDEEVDELDD